MTDRSVVVRMRADIAEFRSKMQQAKSEVSGVGTAAEQAGTKGAKGLGSIGTGLGKGLDGISKHKDSLDQVGRGLTAVGLAAGAGLGAAVKAAADFDQGMSNVAASGADAKANIDALREAAIRAGADTSFSATEAAAGIENLAKAGVSAKDTLGGGLAGALDLAAAGQIGVAEAAETAATALTQFKLEGKDVPHVADLLAAGAGKAQGEVSDLAGALNQSGLVAAQFGLSIEDTTGTLAAFASSGLLGSDAGTSFKTMLLSLANPSANTTRTMKELGIAAYDAQGNFVGITGLADQLKGKLGNLTQAQRDQTLAQIFGTDAIRAANVLYEQGGDGIQSWIDQTNDSGFAAETAATKMDNLKGDLEGLKGAFETALIGAGTGSQSGLREVTQDLTDLVNKFNELSPAAQSNVLKTVGVLAAIGLGGSAVLKTATTVASLRTNLIGLAETSPRAAKGITGVTKAAAGAATALVALQVAGAAQDAQSAKLAISNESARAGLIDLAKGGKSAADTFDSSFGGIIDGVDGVGDAFKLLDGNAGFLQNAGTKFFDLTSGIAGADGPTKLLTEQLGALDSQLAQMPTEQAAKAFKVLAAEAGNVPAEDLVEKFPLLQAQLQKTANDLQVTGLSAQDYAGWMGGTVPPAVLAAQAAQKVSDATKGAAVSASDAIPAFTDLTSANEGLKGAYAELKTAQDEVINNFTLLKNGAADQESANSAWEASIDEVIASTKNKSKTLDADSEAGRTNRKVITDAISALDQKVSADFKANAETKGLTKATEIATEAMKKGRRQILDGAEAAGFNTGKVKDMQDRMLKTPEELRTAIKTDGIDTANSKIGDIKKNIDNIDGKSVNVTVDLSVRQDKLAAQIASKYAGINGPRIPQARHDGGAIQNVSGYGQRGKDTELVLAGVDEHVWTEKEVDAVGGHGNMLRMRQAALRGQLKAFRSGGPVNDGPLNSGPLNRGAQVRRDIDIHGKADVLTGTNMQAVVNAAATMTKSATASLASAIASNLVSATNKKIDEAANSGDFGKIDVSKPRALTTFRGHTFSNLFAASLRAAEKDAGSTLSIFQGGFRPRTSYSGTSHQGDAIDARVNGALISAMRKHGIPTWDRTGKGNWVSHMHGIPLPGAGYPAGSAVWQGQDYLRGGDGLAAGGKVSGPGTDTSDSVPLWGSRDEWMIRAASAKYYGDDIMSALNAGSIPKAALDPYAMTGPATVGGRIGYASGGKLDVDAIYKLLRAITNPVADLAKLVNAVSKAKVTSTSENRNVAGPRAALDRAKRRLANDQEDRQDARDRVARLKRAADGSSASRKKDLEEARDERDRLKKAAAKTKGVTAADRAYEKAKDKVEDLSKPTKAAGALKKAQRDLTEANNAVTRSTTAKSKAQADYDKVATRAKAATEALKDAQKALADQQAALAESARQVSDTFREGYTTKSTDAGDWIALMKEGATDIGKFQSKIEALRKAGLNETLIQQIVGMGAIAGGDIASQIAAGGKGLVNGLNDANKKLQDAADKLGVVSATGAVRKAGGGLLVGAGTGTSDSIPMFGSNGEFMQRKAAVDKYGLGMMNDINSLNFQPMAASHYTTTNHVTHETQVHIAKILNGDPYALAKAIDQRARDAMAVAGLSMAG